MLADRHDEDDHGFPARRRASRRKNSLAADLAAVWRDELTRTFREAIVAEAARNKVDLAARGLTAEALADLLLDGLEGMKSRVTDAEGQREAARRLVNVIALSLQP